MASKVKSYTLKKGAWEIKLVFRANGTFNVISNDREPEQSALDWRLECPNDLPQFGVGTWKQRRALALAAYKLMNDE